MRHHRPALAVLILASTAALVAPAVGASTVAPVGPAVTVLVGTGASNTAGFNLGESCFDAAPGSLGGCTTEFTDPKDSAFYYSTSTVNSHWTSSTTPSPSSWTLPMPKTKVGFVDLARCFSPTSCVQVGVPRGNSQSKYLEADIVRNGVETGANLDIALSANNVALAVSMVRPAAMTCRDLEDCVVTGIAALTSGYLQGMAAVESAGNWTLSLTGPVPTSSVNSFPGTLPFLDPGHSLATPSCPTPTFCAVVGEINGKSHGVNEAYLATETGGKWTATFVMPSDFSNEGYWNGVDCWAANNCLAVGTYQATDGNFHALYATDANGSWSAHRLAALDTLGASSSELGAVACSANASCWVGGEDTVAGSAVPFVIQSPHPRTWNSLSPLAVPAGTRMGYLSSLSCPTSKNCVAVGGYTATLVPSPSPIWINTAGLIATLNKGVWTTTLGASATPAFAGVLEASCSSAGYCDAIGLVQQVLINLQSSQLPAAPSRLRVRATSRVATLTWTAPPSSGSPLETYQYSLNAGVTWRSTKATVTHATLRGLSRSKSYRVRVRAFNGLGAGLPSKVITVTLKSS